MWMNFRRLTRGLPIERPPVVFERRESEHRFFVVIVFILPL